MHWSSPRGPPSRISLDEMTTPTPPAESKKTKVRGGHKAHLKKLLASVNNCMAGFTLDKEAELLGLHDSLKRKAAILAKLDEEILNEITDDDIADEIEACEKVQESIDMKISEIDVLLSRARNVIQKLEGGSAPSRVQSSQDTIEVKLPKLDIPEFGGDPKEYRGFWDAFQVSIDSKATLSKVSKFTHLKKALVGDPARSVRGLECTDANNDEAVDILKKLFGNKNIIISSHMDVLTNLTQVSTYHDTKRLRSLYDKIEGNFRSLEFNTTNMTFFLWDLDWQDS